MLPPGDLSCVCQLCFAFCVTSKHDVLRPVQVVWSNFAEVPFVLHKRLVESGTVAADCHAWFRYCTVHEMVNTVPLYMQLVASHVAIC